MLPLSMDYLQRFLTFINEQCLFKKSETALLAVSGGKDSMLLLHLFQLSGFEFAVAHCNFQLRGADADADEDLVRKTAEALGKPFYAKRFDTERYANETQVSIQMAARDLRYSWFTQLAQSKQYTCIATAHHQHDLIETLLLNLTRGTGLEGLHGILPRRANLIRPLLFLSKAEVEAAVSAWALPYRDDQSNFSTKYARNKIRLEVIPALKAINPAVEKNLYESSKHFHQSELFIKHTVDQMRRQLFKPYQQETYKIALADLMTLKPLQYLLFELFKPFNFTAPVLDDLIRTWDLDGRTGKCFRSQSHQLHINREQLLLSPLNLDKPLQELAIHQWGEERVYGNWRLTLSEHSLPVPSIPFNSPGSMVALDAAKISFPIRLRSWQIGDVFYPLGMNGKKKLSKFFIGLKIPLEEKKGVPIIENGNGDIIWVAPYRLDDRYKIGKNTKKVATFECVKLHGTSSDIY